MCVFPEDMQKPYFEINDSKHSGLLLLINLFILINKYSDLHLNRRKVAKLNKRHLQVERFYFLFFSPLIILRPSQESINKTVQWFCFGK